MLGFCAASAKFDTSAMLTIKQTKTERTVMVILVAVLVELNEACQPMECHVHLDINWVMITRAFDRVDQRRGIANGQA